MEQDDYRFELLELALKTQALTKNPIKIDESGEEDIFAIWEFILEMSEIPNTKDIDWWSVRTLLWDNVPENVLKDIYFFNGISLVFTKLRGQKEAAQGLGIVFRR